GLAVVVVGVVLMVRAWRGRDRQKARAETGKADASLESLLSEAQPRTASELWRQAEEQARQGQVREAVRLLFAGVLALLRRAILSRYERTRTNGEYVAQVRLAADAPAGVREPFEQLTTLFEVKWYGERDCKAADYGTGRRLVDDIRECVKE